MPLAKFKGDSSIVLKIEKRIHYFLEFYYLTVCPQKTLNLICFGINMQFCYFCFSTWLSELSLKIEEVFSPSQCLSLIHNFQQGEVNSLLEDLTLQFSYWVNFYGRKARCRT